jgi:hypothetical protein
MATKKQSPAMEFVVGALKKNPAVDYGTVKAGATKKGLTIFPIMYGRAKALLGLVPVAARGSKKKAKKAPARAAKTKVVRRNSSTSTAPLDSLQDLITDMKAVAQDRDRFQQALEQISKILKATL